MARPTQLPFLILTITALLALPDQISAQGTPGGSSDADPLPQSFPAPFDTGITEDPERLGDQQRLVSLVAEAFERFPDLKQRHTEIQGDWLEAMNSLDPETTARRARLDELGRQLLAARGSRDRERVRTTLSEARPLQAALSETAMEAAKQTDLRQSFLSFRADLLDRMTQIDPDARRIAARSRSASSQEEEQ